MIVALRAAPVLAAADSVTDAFPAPVVGASVTQDALDDAFQDVFDPTDTEAVDAAAPKLTDDGDTDKVGAAKAT